MPGITDPEKGKIYTIRDITIGRCIKTREKNVAIKLVEIHNPNSWEWNGLLYTQEIGFSAACFRPLISKGMETLRSLLKPVKENA